MSTENQDYIAIVDEVFDVEETDQPFGRRYAGQVVRLNETHIAALKAGKVLAIDDQGEYVVFIELEKPGRQV